MKFKIPIEGGDDQINMAPMIDMVFLLLIFFMVASHLTTLERIPLLLPVAERSVVPEETRGRQMITVRSESESGEKVKIYLRTQEMSPEELASVIKEMYEADNKVQIYLRVDRYVRHRHVKAIIAMCAEVGIADVTFGTFESGN